MTFSRCGSYRKDMCHYEVGIQYALNKLEDTAVYII